jgi:hypothetical protein
LQWAGGFPTLNGAYLAARMTGSGVDEVALAGHLLTGC